jgi:serine/threonine protein phosphatase 1
MHWIIGDVHGMLRSLTRLLDAVTAQDTAARLIFVGDYVNRGPDSAKVIDLLLSLPSGQFVRGNHDDIFDLVLHGHSYAEGAAGTSAALAFQWFMDYGLDSTFHSYGADWTWLKETARDPTPQRLGQLSDFVPAAHRDFIRSLPAIVEHDNFFVMHGRWPPQETCYPPAISENLRIHTDLRQQVLWGRYSIEEIESQKTWGKRGFFGHTPVHTYFSNPRTAPMVPIIGKKLVLLDTAAALATWGRLTAFCVEEDRYVQTTHFGELVSE